MTPLHSKIWNQVEVTARWGEFWKQKNTWNMWRVNSATTLHGSALIYQTKNAPSSRAMPPFFPHSHVTTPLHCRRSCVMSMKGSSKQDAKARVLHEARSDHRTASNLNGSAPHTQTGLYTAPTEVHPDTDKNKKRCQASGSSSVFRSHKSPGIPLWVSASSKCPFIQDAHLTGESQTWMPWTSGNQMLQEWQLRERPRPN